MQDDSTTRRARNKLAVTKYRQLNRERLLALGVTYTRKWRERYPEKARALYKLHRHRRRTAEGSFTAAEWEALCERHGNRCLACGRTDLPLTIDHVVPLSLGGTNRITDVQPLCKPCNSAKGDKVIDYRPR